ncbi:MAG: monofunctional biosynthetic peptidoglycan transglycosylase [Elusimicrobia bacterium]|nr:monofunctional biosynthetic peptidoglycan transglycosylase [Elusimicrobiota bacterium]
METSSFLAAGLVASAAGLCAVCYLLWLPDVSSLKSRHPTTTRYTALYARRMARKGQKAGTAMTWVPISAISPHLVQAVLIAEDDRFFRHRGVDWRELEPVLRANLRGERPRRGASTISQQVARNLYLSPERSYGRKVREILIARHLERTLGKERLLEIYLNIVEWGEGVFGAEAASREYFGKAAAELSPEEAVSMAAALPSPYDRNPSVEPDERLLKLRRVYLERLRRKGGLTAPGPEPAPSIQAL